MSYLICLKEIKRTTINSKKKIRFGEKIFLYDLFCDGMYSFVSDTRSTVSPIFALCKDSNK